MSWVSNFIDKVLPGAPMENLTKATFDKWIAPEHKDMVEAIATAVVTAGMAAPLALAWNIPLWSAGMLVGAAAAAGNNNDPLVGAVMGAIGPGGLGKDAAAKLTQAGLSPNLANAVVNMGVAGATGGNVAMAGLSSIPGPLGQVLNSPIGKIVIGMASGGGASGISNFLESIGITGRGKDILEDVATYMALAESGKLLAKDAIELAQKYEDMEGTAIASLSAQAAKYSDPAQLEKAKAAAVEETRAVYTRKGEEMQRDLYARGMGGRSPGPTAALNDAAARSELEARRTTDTDWTNRGMQASAYALGPIQEAANRARTEATAQQQIPFDFYKSVLESRHESPADQYARAPVAQMQNQQGKPGIDLSGIVTSGINAIAGSANNNANVQNTTVTPAPGPLMSPEGFAYGWNGMQNPLQSYRRAVPKFAVKRGGY